MSLGKLTTKVKSGITDVQSMTGIKRTMVHLGIGFTVGVLVDLALEAVWRFSGIATILSNAGYSRLNGFTIFPNNVDAQGSWMSWDDVILVVSSVILLFSKKFWFVIGYTAGWYVSSYLNLWASLGLPTTLTLPLTQTP